MVVAQITTDNREAFRTYDERMPRFGTAPEALIAGLSRQPDVDLHILSCTQQAMVSPERLGERVWFHSLPVPKFGWLRGGYLGCMLALRNALGRIRPDVVHGQGTERECAMGAIFSGYPNVITVHGNMVRVQRLYRSRIGSYHWLAARLENFALRRTGGVFCNSEYTEELVGGRARRRWRVPNAVRDLFFEEAEEPVAGEPILVNIGVICPMKRQVELLDWAERMRREGHVFQLRFAGHLGGDAEYNERFAAGLRRLPGVAHHDGTLVAEQMRSWLDRASGMIHVSAEESFGLAVAEGLARNLKLFAFACGGVVDVMHGIDDAKLCKDGDWDGLTAAVQEWLVAGGRRSATATLAVRRRYHPDVVARRHLEIYREILG
jgi:glycosyltransferase involved in cell wall biosynthesis